MPNSTALWRPANLAYCSRGWLLEKARIWLGRRASDEERKRRYESYLRETLLERAGLWPRRIEILPRYTNPIVCRLECEDRAGRRVDAVARCFERHMGKEKSREHATVSLLLSEHGIDVPRLFDCDDTRLTLGRYQFESVVEECVDGRHPDLDDFRAGGGRRLAELAELLARLHSIAGAEPGRPWRSRHAGKDFIEVHYYRQEERAFERIEAAQDFFAPEYEKRWLKEHLARTRDCIRCPGPYSLVHADLTTSNMMLRDGGEGPIALIDFGTVRYDLWPWDFVFFCRVYLREKPEMASRLLREYFARRPEADRDFFRLAWNYLHPWYHLSKVSASLRKLSRKGEDDLSARQREQLRQHAEANWALAVRAIEEPDLPIG
ncbi:MAG: Phosphotransferase enzyme family protein [candidate division BRC1 bacterium ADurb.BinA364]|nr:MAG: Phosphotransferase enzyme family protein [candidate division BRC1 bacterium ADurb.BinA364]